jgi:hypothetical protein
MPRFASHLDGNLFGPSALLVDYAPFERKVPVMDEYAFTGSRHVNIGQAGSSEFNFAGPLVKDVSSNIRGQPPAPSGSRQKMEQTQAAAETERDLEREAYDKEVEAVACLLKLERKEKRKLEERWVEETKSREEETILAAHLLEMSLPPRPSLPDRTHEAPTSPLQQPETINVEESHDPNAGIEIKPLVENGLSTETVQAGSKLIGKLVPRSEMATAYRLRMEEEEAQRKSAAQRKLLALEERMQAQRIEERVKENGSISEAEVQVEAARTFAELSAPVQSMGTSKPSSNGPITSLVTPHHLPSPPQKFPSPPPTITEADVEVGGDASRSTEVRFPTPSPLSSAEESEVQFKLAGRDWAHNSLQSAAESHEMGTSSTMPDEASFMSNIPMADAVGPPGFDGSAHLVEAFAEVQLKKAHSDKRETSRHAFASGGAEFGTKGSVAKVPVPMSGPPQMSLRRQDDELAAIEPIAALGKADRKPTRVIRDGAKKRPPPGMPLQPTQPNLTEAMLRSVMPQLTPFLFGEHAASNLPNSSFAYTPDRAVAPASPCGDHSAGSGSISRLNRYLGQYQDE